jgi:hypothetical protein
VVLTRNAVRVIYSANATESLKASAAAWATAAAFLLRSRWRTCKDCGSGGKISTGRMTNPVDCAKCRKSGKCPRCNGKG